MSVIAFVLDSKTYTWSRKF